MEVHLKKHLKNGVIPQIPPPVWHLQNYFTEKYTTPDSKMAREDSKKWSDLRKMSPPLPSQVLVNIIFMAVEMYYNHKSGQSACLHSASKTPSFGIVYYSGARRDTQVCHLCYKQTNKHFFNTCNHRFKKWLLKESCHIKDTSNKILVSICAFFKVYLSFNKPI